jgi:hypothetical protein
MNALSSLLAHGSRHPLGHSCVRRGPNTLNVPAKDCHLFVHAGCSIKIIAYDHFKPGVTKGSIKPELLKEEMTRVWQLQRAGIIREIYGRADAPGAVIVFECGTVDEVKDYVAAFPLSKAGLLDWDFLPLIAPFRSRFCSTTL